MLACDLLNLEYFDTMGTSGLPFKEISLLQQRHTKCPFLPYLYLMVKVFLLIVILWSVEFVLWL